jgi:hypothetical protein
MLGVFVCPSFLNCLKTGEKVSSFRLERSDVKYCFRYKPVNKYNNIKLMFCPSLYIIRHPKLLDAFIKRSQATKTIKIPENLPDSSYVGSNPLLKINDDVLKVLINQQLKFLVKRGSSVGIAIRLRNERQRNRGSIIDMRDIFSSSPQLPDRPLAPIQWVPVAFSQRIYWTGHEADHSPPSRTLGKKVRSSPPTQHTLSLRAPLTKNRDKLKGNAFL